MNMTAIIVSPLYFLSPVMTRTGRSSEKQRRFGLVAKLHCLGQRTSACTVEIVQAPRDSRRYLALPVAEARCGDRRRLVAPCAAPISHRSAAAWHPRAPLVA